ncbi:Rieske (2Fe-2S) protein [Roseisolibacter sp. H3M3-2]|uniref:QcrA and Rieske domain-containing protein n=1 Tax=Roseisolibacter sp. H3M3-2 TaxID=3031323 RepID=UPI0023DBECB8|nr:Rieske (2Fe-2S) protein [Roseisolibacter sp. H3M3-2]MDF1505238.1 Rieske (2Fe-2S) protein [Roseisolibacter sp. H3M3-2]
MPALPVLSPAPLTRRDFVGATTCSLVAAALAACGGGGGDGPAGPGGPTGGVGVTPTGATFANNVLTIPLDQNTELAAARGYQIVGSVGGQQVNVIVIRVGDGAFRAFSSICTHEGCTVGSFDGSRITCPCHGSQYDAGGAVVVGPATRALAEYRVAFDAAARTVAVTKG